MDDIRDALMIELAWCRHADLSVSETAERLLGRFINPPKHHYWGAGEPDCPRDIKASNGELHTLRCKVCGEDSPRDSRCFGPVANGDAPDTPQSEAHHDR